MGYKYAFPTEILRKRPKYFQSVENHAPESAGVPLIFEISFGVKANPLPPHGCRMAGWLGGGWVAGWLAGGGGGGGGGMVGNLVSITSTGL